MYFLHQRRRQSRDYTGYGDEDEEDDDDDDDDDDLKLKTEDDIDREESRYSIHQKFQF